MARRRFGHGQTPTGNPFRRGDGRVSGEHLVVDDAPVLDEWRALVLRTMSEAELELEAARTAKTPRAEREAMRRELELRQAVRR